MAFARRLAHTTAPGSEDLRGGLAGGFVGGDLLAVDAVGLACRGELEAIGGDGSGLGEDGLLAQLRDAVESPECLFDARAVEPRIKLGDRDVVVGEEIEHVDVGGQEIEEEMIGVDGVGERIAGGAGVLGLGVRG